MSLDNVLENYEIASPTIEKFETGGVNAEHTYKVHTKEDDFLLKSIRNDRIEWIENSANLTNHLIEHGFTKIPKVLLTKQGNAVFTDSEGINWSLQKFIEARQIRNNDLTQDVTKNLGKVIAELHLTYLNDNSILEEPYVKAEISYYDMFEKEQHEKMIEALEKLRNMEIHDDDKKLINTYWEEYLKTRNKIIEELKKIKEEEFSKSIIHRDLNKGNILFSENSEEVAAIVDWEEIAYGNIVQDIAYVTSHYLTVIEETDLSKRNITAFMNGYEQNIKINQNEKQFIPTLVDILLVRATRWWGKRYLQLIEENASEEKIEKHRGGFRKTLNNWMDHKEKYSNLFNEIFTV